MTTLRKAFSHAVAMAVLTMSLSGGKPLKTISIPASPSELTTHTVSRHSSDNAGLPCVASGGLSDLEAAIRCSVIETSAQLSNQAIAIVRPFLLFLSVT
jgi:hypothetical protein